MPDQEKPLPPLGSGKRPGREPDLHPGHDTKHQQAEQNQNDQPRKGLRYLEERGRETDEIPETGVRGDKFRHHSADNRQSDRYFQRGEDERQGKGQSDLGDFTPPARAQGSGQFDQFLGCRHQARRG